MAVTSPVYGPPPIDGSTGGASRESFKIRSPPSTSSTALVASWTRRLTCSTIRHAKGGPRCVRRSSVSAWIQRKAAYVSDRMLVMYRGEIVEQGPPGEVVWSPKHAYTVRLMADVPRLQSA